MREDNPPPSQITIRDYYATAALDALLRKDELSHVMGSRHTMATLSYEIADAWMDERQRRQGGDDDADSIV